MRWALLVGLVVGCVPPSVVSHEGRAVVRVPVSSPEELVRAAALGDVWTEHPRGWVDVEVPWRSLAYLPPGATVEVPDVAKAVEASLVPFGDGFYDGWSDLEDLHDRMEDLAALYPAAELVEIGVSEEGRPLLGLRLGDGGYDARRGTLITGGLHAREWVAVHSALYIAERLLEDDGIDPVVTALLDEQKVLVVPVVNPDGYRYTWTTDRLWRKNRHDNGDGSFGIDLNRNFTTGWGGPGSSGSTASNNYRGVAPLSEPESAAVAEFLALHPRYDRHIDLHCTGQLALHPWGHTVDAPVEDDALSSVAVAAAEAMTAVHATPYDAGQASTRLYLASGMLIDHAHGLHGAQSLLLELRDRGRFGFLLPADQLLPTAEEAYEGVWEVLAADGLQLHLSVLQEGPPTLVRVTRADGPVWLAASREGPAEATSTGLGPDLQVASPALFGPVDPGPRGGVTFQLTPPAGWGAGPLYWQAFTATHRSPVLRTD